MTGVPDWESGYEASIALVDSWSRRAQDQVDRADAMQRDVDALAVSRWSPGREVCVTLDSSGMLTRVRFAEPARSRSAAALSRAVLTAVRGAMDDLEARVREIAERHAGPDGFASSLLASYGQALSTPLVAHRPGDDVLGSSGPSGTPRP